MSKDLAMSIEAGATLPALWYTDRSVFEQELDRVFRRSWQYAAATAEVAGPGDFVTLRAGRVLARP